LQIHSDENKNTIKPPAILKVMEVENKRYSMTRLQPKLKASNFTCTSIVLMSGIDVALLYREDLFEVLEAKPITLLFRMKRDTRHDQYYIRQWKNMEHSYIFM
jgi:hypothetical protein